MAKLCFLLIICCYIGNGVLGTTPCSSSTAGPANGDNPCLFADTSSSNIPWTCGTCTENEAACNALSNAWATCCYTSTAACVAPNDDPSICHLKPKPTKLPPCLGRRRRMSSTNDSFIETLPTTISESIITTTNVSGMIFYYGFNVSQLVNDGYYTRGNALHIIHDYGLEIEIVPYNLNESSNYDKRGYGDDNDDPDNYFIKIEDGLYHWNPYDDTDINVFHVRALDHSASIDYELIIKEYDDGTDNKVDQEIGRNHV
eukprot:138778_1